MHRRIYHFRRETRVTCHQIRSQSSGDFLKNPGVSIGIFERSGRGIALPVRAWTINQSSGIDAVEHAASVMEYFGTPDTPAQQIGPGDLDIRHHEVGGPHRDVHRGDIQIRGPTLGSHRGGRQFGGSIARDWKPTGFEITIALYADKLWR